MYHHLEGKLVEKSATSIVLDVNGIGYYIHVPLSTYSGLSSVGSTAKILTHFVVREDAHLLFGFHTEEERELFRQLLSVSGIGPKVAMTALSGLPVIELKTAIAEGSIAVLSSIPGIGRKTAERIVVELKEKMVLEKRTLSSGSGAVLREDSITEDAVRALVSLGYTAGSAKKALEKVMKEDGAASKSVEDIVRKALKFVS